MQRKKVTPVNGHVLVQYEVAPNVTEGGIYLPAQQGKSDPTQRAKVLAVSKDIDFCKPGDTVYVFISSGMSVERLYRGRHRPEQGDIKLYKKDEVFAVVADAADDDNSLDVIEAFGIEDLTAIVKSPIKEVKKKIITV